MREKKVVCFGEVLWDKLPGGRRLGGAPLNVCYHLTQQAINAKVISQVGDDEDGLAILNEMSNLKVDASLCKIAKEHPTSTVEVHLQADGQVNYEIVDQVAWDYIAFEESVAAQVANSDAFVFGSLAARNEQSRNTLITYLPYAKWKVMDVNLRAPFYHKELIIQLISQCQTLKINSDELELLAAWLSFTELKESAILASLLVAFPAMEEIILTKGSDGAVYAGRQETLHVPAFPVHVVDTVGSGDAFLAAFIANRLQGKTVIESMKAGAVLSAFVAIKSGACPPYTPEMLNVVLMQ
jgi:fructokinase